MLTATLGVAWIIFLSSGVVSLLSDTLLLAFDRQDLALVAALGSLSMLFTGFILFGLMALIPGIPKRFFLPISLFLPVTTIAVLPLLVYFWDRTPLIFLGLSVGQIALGIIVLHRWHGRLRFCWPLFPEQRLVGEKFNWGNLASVLSMGLFLLAPAGALYAAFSAKLAVAHFTAGFVALRPAGITMQARNYERDDGKKIMLVPMSHVGEATFYRDVAASFPANAVILMEGVSDTKRIVNTRSDYARGATLVGGVEQAKAFRPKGEIVAADLDMSAFSQETRDLLKSVLLIYAKGVTRETLPVLMKPWPPAWEKQLMDDLLTKRNRHLVGVIQERLPTSEIIVVPWGAAHMPEIHREIQKLGFRVVETKDYVAIRFGS